MAVATAFISVNGAIAALLPVVVMASTRLRRLPSRLLLPMVFAAHAGSMLALTGTPVNVIVSDAAVDAGAGRFGYFDFALVGLPAAGRHGRDRRAVRAPAAAGPDAEAASRRTSASTPGR